MILEPEEMLTFDMYFASICSMQFHPGAGTKEHQRLGIDECMEQALKMIEARRTIRVRG